MSTYKELPGLNQSTLKKILTSPWEYQNSLKNTESKADHFTFGSLVDCFLTETKEEYEAKYFVVDENDFPSEAIQVMIKHLFDHYTLISAPLGSLLDIDPSHLLLVLDKYQYQSKWKPETRIAKLSAEGEKYYKFLVDSMGKTIVTKTDVAKAKEVTLSILGMKGLDTLMRKNPNSTILNKFIISFVYSDYLFKGELDRVVIDHRKKEITPIDFKTTSKSLNTFNDEFWKYRYDFQAAVYTRGLIENEEIQNYLRLGYKLKNFLYIVADTYMRELPRAFEVTPSIIRIGWEGGTLSNGKALEGVEDAIIRYRFAENNNLWQYPKEYYEQGNRLFIKI